MVEATSESLTIGSAPGNDLVTTDTTVSRYHVELRRQSDRILVEDHRSTNGTCLAYGPDACGPSYTCVPRCLQRGLNGDCTEWGQDVCGPNMACARRCTARDGGGTCNTWEADVCGEGAVCIKHCENRGNLGACFSYSADHCEAGN